jgi:serine beta-lactamase-like protein LACTB
MSSTSRRYTRRASAIPAICSAIVLASLLPIAGSAAHIQAAATASAKSAQQQLPPATIDAITAAAKSFLMSSHSPAVSIAIVTHGQLAFAQGYGEADTTTHRLATPDTLYRLASVSKPLTATGAMQLVQAGKLDLDAPVQKYCPQFPEKPHVITTRELLGHLGGIRHYRMVDNDPELLNIKHFADPIAGGLSFFANDPLVEVPGEKFHYSTMGYTLVGCAMEGASGTKYVDYMTKNVFAPAGMRHTIEDDNTATIPERTAFYSVKDGKVAAALPLDSSYKIPGGGWLSSATIWPRTKWRCLVTRS